MFRNTVSECRVRSVVYFVHMRRYFIIADTVPIALAIIMLTGLSSSLLRVFKHKCTIIIILFHYTEVQRSLRRSLRPDTDHTADNVRYGQDPVGRVAAGIWSVITFFKHSGWPTCPQGEGYITACSFGMLLTTPNSAHVDFFRTKEETPCFKKRPVDMKWSKMLSSCVELKGSGGKFLRNISQRIPTFHRHAVMQMQFIRCIKSVQLRGSLDSLRWDIPQIWVSTSWTY